MKRSLVNAFDRRFSIFLIAINVVGWAVSLNNGLSLDDFNWLERARFAAHWRQFIFQPEPGQVFAPVTQGAFWLMHAVAGDNPLVYRIPLLAIHILNAFLLYQLGIQILRRRRAAAFAAAFFSLNSAASESIFWIATFYHPITATLALGTLLAFMRYVKNGQGRSLALAICLCALGFLSKASFFAILGPLGAYVPLCMRSRAGRVRGATLFAVLVVLALAVFAANRLWGVRESYLIERGYYAIGFHILANLDFYLVRVFFPFKHFSTKLGLEALYFDLFFWLRWLIPVVLVASCVLGKRKAAWITILLLSVLLPYLPFTMAPTSRYTYLACAAAGLLAGWGFDRAGAWLSRRRADGRLLASSIFALILLAFALNTWVEDSDYEYREREMKRLVLDVREIYPTLSPGARIIVLDLPLFAVDRGIHFQAALRLDYSDATLQLIAPEPTGEDTSYPAGDRVLRYVNQRIVRSMTHKPARSLNGSSFQ